LGQSYPQFKAEGFEIVLILGDTLEKAKRYVEILHLPFPVLADPERNIYHLYGLEKVLFTIQRTASVVIDRQGIIRYWRTATNPMTWLEEITRLLSFVKSMPKGN
jgi:peroxiredoxin